MRAEMQTLADEITQAISLLRRHLDWEKANTRKRIQQQKDIHGQALAPKKGNKRGKVMRRMAKGLTPYVRNANTLDLTWSNPLTAKIAARHHLGQKQKMTKPRGPTAIRLRWSSRLGH